jgi:hypothetical protein
VGRSYGGAGRAPSPGGAAGVGRASMRNTLGASAMPRLAARATAVPSQSVPAMPSRWAAIRPVTANPIGANAIEPSEPNEESRERSAGGNCSCPVVWLQGEQDRTHHAADEGDRGVGDRR